MDEIKIPTESLRELPSDERDFELGAIFPTGKIEDVQNITFFVANPIQIKDQGNTDLCSGYAVTAVSEDQEGVELLPEYQFYKTKKISGKPEEWGADLRDACKSAVKFGSLPLNGNENKKGISRSIALDDKTWTEEHDKQASLYRKETFFSVKGEYDTFDNIRLALWQNKDSKSSIVTGAKWRMEWLSGKDGIIPENYGNSGFGHAFKIFGQKMINGTPYLVAQLSQGDGYGDNGLFYMSRNIVNKEIGRYGVYMFKDISREDAEFFIKNNIKINASIFQKLWAVFISLFRK